MSDTVTASAIVASLADGGPSFILAFASDDPAHGVAAATDAGSFHVGGSAHCPAPTSGYGPPLLVDFVTWNPVAGPTMASPTVPGYGAGSDFHDLAVGVAGAMYVAFDTLP